MPPKDTGLTYEFYSVVVRKSQAFGNYIFTVYAIGEFGSKPIKDGGYNTTTETLLAALRRYGYAPTNKREAIKQLLQTHGNFDGLVLTVVPID